MRLATAVSRRLPNVTMVKPFTLVVPDEVLTQICRQICVSTSSGTTRVNGLTIVTLGSRLLTAVARRMHRNLGTGKCLVQLLLDVQRFDGFTALGQAFVQSVQACTDCTNA